MPKQLCEGRGGENDANDALFESHKTGIHFRPPLPASSNPTHPRALLENVCFMHRLRHLSRGGSSTRVQLPTCVAGVKLCSPGTLRLQPS